MEPSTSPLYRPLRNENTSARLVVIQPGQFSAPIECNLKYVELPARPRYEALSYVWGDPTRTVPIRLDGHEFHITLNLESALRHLRYLRRTRTLWIDAICINQTDLLERSKQVLLMRVIYNLAQTVLIWLGKDREEPSTYDGDDDNFAAAATVFAGARRIASLPAKEKFSYLDLFPSGSKSENRFIMRMMVVLSRPWFQRIWTLQEVAFARSARMMCGTASISFRVFAKAVLRMESVTDAEGGYDLVRDLLLRSFLRTACCRDFASDLDSREGCLATKLVDLLFMVVSHREASDPRDRLYGILGICCPNYKVLDAAIKPNYQKGAAEVFKGLAKYLIQECGSLDILCGDHESMDGAPSWVPTWGRKTGGNVLGFYSPPSETTISVPGLEVKFEFLEDDNILRVKGAEIGQIGVVGSQASFEGVRTASPLWLQPLFRQWEEEIVECVSAQNRSELAEDPLEVQKSAVMYDLQSDRVDRQNVFAYMSIDDIIMGHMEVADPRISATMIRSALRRCYKLEGQYPLVTTFGDKGITNDGSRLEPRIGDIICLLVGGPVPFILRKEANQYRYIGACYMANFMEFEVQQEILRQGPLRDFDIA